MTDIPQTVEDEIRTAYADAGPQRDMDAYVKDMRCLSFCSTMWLTAEQAKAAVELIGQYNRFSPDGVAWLIDRVTDADNSALFVIGREGSPVIYIETDSASGVMGAIGPRSYEADPDQYPSNPDEMGEVDQVSLSRLEAYGDGEDQYDVHSMCAHEAPPVEVRDIAVADDDREIVRCWWD